MSFQMRLREEHIVMGSSSVSSGLNRGNLAIGKINIDGSFSQSPHRASQAATSSAKNNDDDREPEPTTLQTIGLSGAKQPTT